jgi:hypothetical protein
MHHHTFRNAWFACTALDKSFELGRPPFNVLLFTKRESGGHGAFEGFLEEINGPLSQAFTTRWVKHSTELCGVGHKVLVGDGHMKTHFECCNNKNGALCDFVSNYSTTFNCIDMQVPLLLTPHWAWLISHARDGQGI